MTDLARHRKKLGSLLGEHAHACKKVEEEGNALGKAKQHLADVAEARGLIQGVARVTQEQAHRQISSVVTRCLQAVFGEDAYTFAVRFEEKRHKTEARLVFLRDGLEIDPTTAAGGGVVDVAALALRLACLMLARPKKRRLLVLDEPCRFINGEEYQSRVGSLLLTLAKELGVQMVIVTDDEWLKIGKVIELG